MSSVTGKPSLRRYSSSSHCDAGTEPPSEWIDLVDQQRQWARGREGRIELAQGAGGGVARIEVGLLARLLQLAIQRLETPAMGMKASPRTTSTAGTPDLLVGGNRNAQRDGLERAQVGGDVLAHLAVAARGALGEDTVAVVQNDGQAVDLRLNNEFGRTATRSSSLRTRSYQARASWAPKAFASERIGAGGGPWRSGRQAVAPARWVGESARDPGRIVALDLLELVQQAIVLSVADDRRIQHVIAIIVEIDLCLELFVASARWLVRHGQIIARKSDRRRRHRIRCR